MKKVAMPLQSVVVEQQFSQWVLDFVGSINLKYRKWHMYILTTTDYFKKWLEVVVLKKVDATELIGFLKDNILLSFGVPDKFIIDNGLIFIG
jgi:hypothetical protein